MSDPSLRYAELNRQREDLGQNIISGAVVFFAGLLCILFFNEVFWLGIFMLLAGALTYFSAKKKQRGLAAQIKELINEQN